jgi:hypothetical protein
VRHRGKPRFLGRFPISKQVLLRAVRVSRSCSPFVVLVWSESSLRISPSSAPLPRRPKSHLSDILHSPPLDPASGSSHHCNGILQVGRRKPLRPAWNGRHTGPCSSNLPPRSDGDTLYIAEIMHGIKGASAHKINRLLNRSGQVWQRESFDRVLRREESIHAKVEYMIQNPVRAGLVQNAMEYSWLWVSDLAMSA